MKQVKESLYIQNIHVEELFGVFNYAIPSDDVEASVSNLLVLYGDNGAGKTTIIKILFYLLSAHDNKGHKSALANIKFKKFIVKLSNGESIIAERPTSTLGSYTVTIKIPKKKSIQNVCQAKFENGEYVIRDSVLDDMFDHIRHMNLSLHFISDDRKIENTYSLYNISKIPRHILSQMEHPNNINKSFLLNDAILEAAIKEVEEWFRFKAFEGASQGQESLNSIYFDVVEKLLDQPEVSNSDTLLKNKEEILISLKNLQEKNKSFMKYKLTQDFNLGRFITIITKSSDQGIVSIQNIINPFIDSIEQKLNALNVTKNLIDVFITILNQFYTGKTVEFDIKNGLTVRSDYLDKSILNPNMLSSGEKQLLLLFCTVITSRNHASIFIIDEPELSLNIKWQRILIKSLLACSEGSSIQFIFASHSIELLSQYKSQVSKLNHIVK